MGQAIHKLDRPYAALTLAPRLCAKFAVLNGRPPADLFTASPHRRHFGDMLDAPARQRRGCRPTTEGQLMFKIINNTY